MHDRVVGEADRMRAALRSKQYREALRICRRLTGVLIERTRELSTPTNGQRRRPPRGTRSTDTVPLSYIAHELGIDPRTLRHYILHLPFVSHPSERVWLVHRPSFAEWYEKNGRQLR